MSKESIYNESKGYFEELLPRPVFLGVSMSASWAWGVSIVLTMQFLLTKGEVPFLFWALANSLAIPVFGYVAYKLKHLQAQLNNVFIKYSMVIIQLFSLWVQIQAIYQISMEIGLSQLGAKVLGMGAGVFFVVLVLKKGLKMSMFTDQIQWIITIGAGIMLMFLGMRSGTPANLPLGMEPENIKWAWLGSLILLSGPYVDLQQWQRARVAFKEEEYSAFLWGGIAFALYMFLCFVAFQFQATRVMYMFILVITLMVSTSTMDSSAVALHELRGPKFGAVVGILAVVGWPLVTSLGVMGLWATYGIGRMYIVGVMLVIAIYKKYVGEEEVDGYLHNANQEEIYEGVF